MEASVTVPKTRQTGSKEKLLETALVSFAEQGIHGMSLSEINERAGVRNRSAVHYHFKGRDGLILAVLEYIADALAPYHQEAMSDLRELENSGTVTPRDIVQTMHLPLFVFYAEHKYGNECVRVLSRMTSEIGDIGQKMLVQVFGQYFLQLKEMLIERLPPERAKGLNVRFMLSANNLFHCLPDMKVLAFTSTPFYPGTKNFNYNQLIGDYIDFQCAGIFGIAN